MRARLFRYALIMAVVPIASVLLALTLWKQALPRYAFVLLGSVMQIPIVLLCKNNRNYSIILLSGQVHQEKVCGPQQNLEIMIGQEQNQHHLQIFQLIRHFME